MKLFLASLQMLSAVGTEEMAVEDVLGSSAGPSRTRNLDTCMARKSRGNFDSEMSSSGIHNCEWTVENVVVFVASSRWRPEQVVDRYCHNKYKQGPQSLEN